MKEQKIKAAVAVGSLFLVFYVSQAVIELLCYESEVSEHKQRQDTEQLYSEDK